MRDAESARHAEACAARDARASLIAARERIRELSEAVALHARTLDDIALGKPDGRDRDQIDNELYNAVRRLDPAWWDRRVPGLAVTEVPAA